MNISEIPGIKWFIRVWRKTNWFWRILLLCTIPVLIVTTIVAIIFIVFAVIKLGSIDNRIRDAKRQINTFQAHIQNTDPSHKVLIGDYTRLRNKYKVELKELLGEKMIKDRASGKVEYEKLI